jgi:hypothetical protein
MEAGGLAVSSGDVCMIGAVVGSICRHVWRSEAVLVMMVLMTVLKAAGVYWDGRSVWRCLARLQTSYIEGDM